MRTITCWRWRAVFGDDGSLRFSTIILLRAAISLSGRRGISPSRKSTTRRVSIWVNSHGEIVLRWCLACWLGTGDSPMSHATTVVALRLLGATGLGGDLIGHFARLKRPRRCASYRLSQSCDWVR